jgi:uncharacterized membrane protein
MLLYSLVFGTLTWRQQSNFGTFGFDMGIYDQGIWLVSRGRTPFVTVRGLNYFGHHVNLVTLLLVPGYWLGGGPHLLYLVETLALASGAAPLYLLGVDRIGRAWPAAILALTYLLYPSLEWINWWHFHPDALIIAPLLWAYLFARRRRLRPFVISVIIALSCKEDAALAVLVLGLLIAYRAWRTHVPTDDAGESDADTRADAGVGGLAEGQDARRHIALTEADGGRVGPLGVSDASERGAKDGDERARGRDKRGTVIGLGTAGVAAAWFVACTRVIIPHANGGIGPLYEELFPGLGTSVPQIFYNAIRHPSRLISPLTEAHRRTYYWKLLAPVAFVPLLALPVVLIGGPQTLINAMSAHVYTYDIRFHYSSIVAAAVFLGTVESVAYWRRRPFILWGVVVAVLLTSLAANRAWSPSPLGRDYRTGIWAHAVPKHKIVNRALAMIPAGEGVSATYDMVPHLTHREQIFEFSNPWIVQNWGIHGERPPTTGKVEWILLDEPLDPNLQRLFDALTAPGGQFHVVLSQDGVTLAHRVRPPDTPLGPPASFRPISS